MRHWLKLSLLAVGIGMLTFCGAAYATLSLVSTNSGAAFIIRWVQFANGDKGQATALLNPDESIATIHPATTGGAIPFTFQVVASDNHQTPATGAHCLYHLSSTTTNNTGLTSIRLYDAATGFNGCASTTNLRWQKLIPANSPGFIEDFGVGICFSSGISACVTSGYSQTDTTAAVASTVEVSGGYK